MENNELGREAEFDPSRIAALHADEQLILAALTDAYQRHRLEYLHYSPAYDATVARLAALSWHLPASAEVTPDARKDPS
jgi:hypothetical protein